MLEAIVMGLCAGGWNCNDASQAYLKSNKELENQIVFAEKQAKTYIGQSGERVLVVLAPAAAVAAGKPMSIKITSFWSVGWSPTGQSTTLHWNF